MILRGMVLAHRSGADPTPVDIDGMEFREKLDDGRVFPYPVLANFDQSKSIGWANVYRDPEDRHLYAVCHVHAAMLPDDHTHLAVAFSLAKLAREANSTLTRPISIVTACKLLTIGTCTANVDPSIPPFTREDDGQEVPRWVS